MLIKYYKNKYFKSLLNIILLATTSLQNISVECKSPTQFGSNILDAAGLIKHQQVFVDCTKITSTTYAESTRLPKLSTYPDWITLSGSSSGGTFAQQLQFSYSSLFSGIAVFSHAYYRCGPGDGIQANYDNACTKLGNLPDSQLYNPNNVFQDIQQYLSQGLIEDPNNLRNKRLYVYAGTNNVFFSTDQSLRILNIYEPFIQNTCSIQTRVQTANLTLPSAHFGGPCAADSSNNFFISNCGLSGPFDALHFLLGEAIRFEPPRNGPISLQPVRQFDQSEFFYGLTGRHDMDTIGFYYIPTNCIQSTCLVHFYFHGCLTGREFVMENHIRNSGYLEVGELNNIIMIFPQALSSPENDIGCWDTYGVTGPLYATQRGAQVTVVRNMISRILGQDQVLAPQPAIIQTNFI